MLKMDVQNLVFIISRLVVGAGAAFLAIILWSRTRDSAWMFIVVGTIFRYGQVMYETFSLFGIVEDDIMLFKEYISLDTVLENLPYLFFITAFIIMLRRSFRRW